MEGTALMQPSPDTSLSDEQSRLIATLIREELARRRITRQLLADQAKISIATLKKALSDKRPFTLATTIRLEQALGVALRTNHAPVPVAHGVAPDELGFYSRRAVQWVQGVYLTLRPSL